MKKLLTLIAILLSAFATAQYQTWGLNPHLTEGTIQRLIRGELMPNDTVYAAPWFSKIIDEPAGGKALTHAIRIEHSMNLAYDYRSIVIDTISWHSSPYRFNGKTPTLSAANAGANPGKLIQLNPLSKLDSLLINHPLPGVMPVNHY